MGQSATGCGGGKETAREHHGAGSGLLQEAWQVDVRTEADL